MTDHSNHALCAGMDEREFLLHVSTDANGTGHRVTAILHGDVVRVCSYSRRAYNFSWSLTDAIEFPVASMDWLNDVASGAIPMRQPT